jgi:hypothetical protein
MLSISSDLDVMLYVRDIPLRSPLVTHQVVRLKLLVEGLHIVGGVVVVGWKGCNPAYCKDMGWLHLSRRP